MVQGTVTFVRKNNLAHHLVVSPLHMQGRKPMSEIIAVVEAANDRNADVLLIINPKALLYVAKLYADEKEKLLKQIEALTQQINNIPIIERPR